MNLYAIWVSLALAQVSSEPDPGQLPGSPVFQNIINGVQGWALWGALVAMFLGAGAWAVGRVAGSSTGMSGGRIGVIAGAVAAFAIGMAPRIVNWAYALGR